MRIGRRLCRNRTGKSNVEHKPSVYFLRIPSKSGRCELRRADQLRRDGRPDSKLTIPFICIPEEKVVNRRVRQNHPPLPMAFSSSAPKIMLAMKVRQCRSAL